MKNIQTGFTILELMVVVAVIGIIATIAIPIYADYISRGKVSESVRLLSGLRMPMQEHYIANDSWPSVASVGGRVSGTYTSLLTSSTDPDKFYVEAVLKGSLNSELGGKKIRMVYFTIENKWVCTTENASPPIPPQYIPSSCK